MTPKDTVVCPLEKSHLIKTINFEDHLQKCSLKHLGLKPSKNNIFYSSTEIHKNSSTFLPLESEVPFNIAKQRIEKMKRDEQNCDKFQKEINKIVEKHQMGENFCKNKKEKEKIFEYFLENFEKKEAKIDLNNQLINFDEKEQFPPKKMKQQNWIEKWKKIPFSWSKIKWEIEFEEKEILNFTKKNCKNTKIIDDFWTNLKSCSYLPDLVEKIGNSEKDFLVLFWKHFSLQICKKKNYFRNEDDYKDFDISNLYNFKNDTIIQNVLYYLSDEEMEAKVYENLNESSKMIRKFFPFYRLHHSIDEKNIEVKIREAKNNEMKRKNQKTYDKNRKTRKRKPSSNKEKMTVVWKRIIDENTSNLLSYHYLKTKNRTFPSHLKYDSAFEIFQDKHPHSSFYFKGQSKPFVSTQQKTKRQRETEKRSIHKPSKKRNY